VGRDQSSVNTETCKLGRWRKKKKRKKAKRLDDEKESKGIPNALPIVPADRRSRKGNGSSTAAKKKGLDITINRLPDKTIVAFKQFSGTGGGDFHPKGCVNEVVLLFSVRGFPLTKLKILRLRGKG